MMTVQDSFKDMDDLDGDDWTGGPKELIPPPDQVALTDQELMEEFTRVLNAKNPHAPPNIVQFHYKDRVFKQVSSVVFFLSFLHGLQIFCT